MVGMKTKHIKWTVQQLRKLELIHFLTKKTNMKIVKALLGDTAGLSRSDVAKLCDISKGNATNILDGMVQRRILQVSIYNPTKELERPTKSYKLIYLLKPRQRMILNEFIDALDKIENLLNEKVIYDSTS